MDSFSPLQSDNIKANLKKINEFDYDIFQLNTLVGKKTLPLMTADIFEKNNYFNKLVSKTKFKNFILKINDGYDRNVPYHNDLHGADVMQTLHCLLVKGEIQKVTF